jgi:hypothetical protein
MDVHHIFIFSSNQGKEVDELVDFGLTEGSNRVHPGQGTRNRKFYFENFFLEILWVSYESEIKSELTAPAKLWERANHKRNGFSPFGICLVNSKQTDELFKNSFKYQPVYLPDNLAIDVITNEERPGLPWIFRLPTIGNLPPVEEPINHRRDIKRLTGVKFQMPFSGNLSEFIGLFNQSDIIFEHAEQYNLVLEFDYKKQEAVQKFSSIPLTIEY